MILRKVLSVASLIPASLIAALFAFIEIRSLIAGDFTLMNNPGSSFAGYLFRGLLFLALLICSIILMISKIRNLKTSVILFGSSVGVFIGTLISFAYFQFVIAIVIVAFSIIPLLITSLDIFYFEKKQNKKVSK